MTTIEELQRTIHEQQKQLACQEAQLASREAQLEEATSVRDKLAREKRLLESELAVLLNRLYRPKSERAHPDQQRLFSSELMTPTPEGEGIPRKRDSSTRAKGHGRQAFPEHLPREEIVLDLADDEKHCECGKGLKRIGEEITERGHIIPARVIVRRYVRPKYACPEGHTVRTANLPSSLIDRAKYEPSAYAYLATAKYADHLPLHRLEGIFRRHGVELSKSTMWDMLSRLDEVVAKPIVEQMHREVLEEEVLQADETPVTVLLESKGGSKKGYLWCYGNGIRRVFDFTMSRERDGPRRFLGGWKGTLQTDGYSGYDAVTRENGLIRAGCWSHARRKVKEALDAGEASAAQVFLHIQRLFRIESALKKRKERRSLDADSFRELRDRIRKTRSQGVLQDIQQAAESLRRKRATVPRGILGRALRYLENQWEPLKECILNPDLEIHNNDAERALRHVAIGRKNWNFFGSPRGGDVGHRLFTLALACRALNLNPAYYFQDVIQRVDTTPATKVAELTPWAWAIRQLGDN